jgi:hypothetical protein
MIQAINPLADTFMLAALMPMQPGPSCHIGICSQPIYCQVFRGQGALQRVVHE